MVSLNRGMVITSTPSGIACAGASAAGFSVVSAVVAGTSTAPKWALMSSSFSPIIAKSVSTGAVSPSEMPMCNSVPSLKDSNSMVALSVSISASMSPS